ncbi:hypothetical protein JCM5353_007300 [Sporobolomyces roseus]
MAQPPPLSIPCLWRNPISNTCCQRTFVDTTSLISHLFDDHIHPLRPAVIEGKKRWPCLWSKCENTYSTKALLENHLSQHNVDFAIPEYACDICQPKLNFNTAIKLFNHHQDVHEIRDDTTESRDGGGKLGLAQSQFADPVLPARRSRPPPHKPTYDRNLSKLPPPSTQSSSNMPSCEWMVESQSCRAQSTIGLLQHVSSEHLVHRIPGSTKWECRWRNCASKYSNRSQLVEHVAKIHLEVSLHFCEPCQASFPTGSTLTHHQQNHEIFTHQSHKEEEACKPSCKFCMEAFRKLFKSSTSPSTRSASPAPTSTASTSSPSTAAPPPLQTSYRAMPSQAGPLSSSSFPHVPFPLSYYTK